MLVDRLADLVDSWVVSDCIVNNINQGYFIVFASGILIDPMRVENLETTSLLSSTFLYNWTLAALICGLTIRNTLRDWPLPHALLQLSLCCLLNLLHVYSSERQRYLLRKLPCLFSSVIHALAQTTHGIELWEEDLWYQIQQYSSLRILPSGI